jgi:hypothetical protein
MRIKVRGGTPPGGSTSLCHTCRHATIVKGARIDDEIVECDALSYGHNRVTFSVRYCTAYIDSRRPSIRDMEDIAWVLRTDPKRNQIGFVQAKDLKPRDRFVLDEE